MGTSIKDVIKNGFLNNFMNSISLPTVITTTVISFAFAIGVYIVYLLTCDKTIYSKKFNIAMSLMTIITSALVMSMQANIVISLGMVGALSIVRFRTAIKEPKDLLFLFWAISNGIIIGAGLYSIALVLAVVLSIALLVFELIPARRKAMLLVVNLKNVEDVIKVEEKLNTLAKEANKVADKSWTIGLDAKANGEFYEKVEEILIARQLWKIDREVVLAKNYDYKTVKYDAMTESEKSEAKGFASTYTSSNAKPLHEVAKANKITAQQEKYYSEPDYYTKSTYTNVLPSTLTSLRGTSAKNIISNLVRFGEENSKVESGQDNNFLLPVKDGLTDPVYLDVASSTYYICEVSEWYGKFYYECLLDTSKPTKSIPNYQIEAYQSGQIKPWKLNEAGTRYVEDTSSVVSYQTNASAFESVIELVQLSANNILTDAMKKEAIVALFEKYNLEINDQDIYDYVSSQYPDFFEEEE